MKNQDISLDLIKLSGTPYKPLQNFETPLYSPESGQWNPAWTPASEINLRTAGYEPPGPGFPEYN